jgi:hypothetical protein
LGHFAGNIACSLDYRPVTLPDRLIERFVVMSDSKDSEAVIFQDRRHPQVEGRAHLIDVFRCTLDRLQSEASVTWVAFCLFEGLLYGSSFGGLQLLQIRKETRRHDADHKSSIEAGPVRGAITTGSV